MKILLISANSCGEPYPVYPLALSYLSCAISKCFHDAEIKMYDVNIDKNSDLEDIVKSYKPDYIGISLRNIDNVNLYNQKNFIYDYRDMVQALKKITESTVIVGGAGFSIYPEKLFSFLGCDFAVVGEGENAICELIQALEAKKEYGSIEGLVFKGEKGVEINGRNNFFSGISFEMDERLSDFYWVNSGMMNVQTKRGCPYRCIYCSYPVIEGKTVRMLEPETVVSTIEKATGKGHDYFFFTDSVFNMKPEYNREFANLLIERNINVKWGAYFRPAGTSFEDLELFKESGLTHIEWGTESFSDPVLKSYGKEFNFNEIKEMTEMCHQLKIYNAHFLILGGYGETEETLKETFERSKLLPWTVFFPFIGMRIYPLTPLFDIAVKEGVINEHDDLMESKYYLSKGVDLTMEKLRALADSTGKRWVFPDEDHAPVLKRLKSRGKRGPLWEFLVN
jgi:radical SAM superfamily enzyme YgiQ (UPF0313 family)